MSPQVELHLHYVKDFNTIKICLSFVIHNFAIRNDNNVKIVRARQLPIYYTKRLSLNCGQFKKGILQGSKVPKVVNTTDKKALLKKLWGLV